GSAIKCDHRRPTSHGFDHHQSEGFRPINRYQQPNRAAEKLCFFLVADFSDIFNKRRPQKRLYDLFVVFLIDTIDLGGNFKWYAAPPGDSNGLVHGLFWCDSAECGQVSRLCWTRRQQILGNAVIDRFYPISLQDWSALRIGDRNEGRSAERFEDRLMLWKI